MSQNALGRGLSSLIPNIEPKTADDKRSSDISTKASVFWSGDSETKQHPTHVAVNQNTNDTIAATVIEIPVGKIIANPYQPRKTFEQEALEDLKRSIEKHGILQPLVVVARGEGFELIAGERRYRSALELGFATVPAIVRDVAKQQQLELSLIENIQRQNLNPVEEALSYKQLADEFLLSQESIAEQVGKSRSTVANTLRLLQLPEVVQTMLAEGKLTFGHGKILLELDSPEKQIALAKKIVRQQLTVRDTSDEVKETKGTRVAAHTLAAKSPRVVAWEKELQTLLGTKVTIKDTKGKGKIEIEYFSEEELSGLMKRFEEVDDLL